MGLLVAIPYGVALLHPPATQLLAKTLYYGNDLSQYVAAMGDGANSNSWLVRDHLSAEPHDPALMYPFYVLLGKIAGILGWSYLPVFSLAIAAAVPAITFASYAFAATFVSSEHSRRLALAMILLSSGLGIWAAAVAGPGAQSSPASADLSYDRAEVSSYLLPFGPPHLTLALATLLLWGRCLAVWCWQGQVRSLLMLGLAVAAIGLLNPFTLATLVALSGTCALVRWIAARQFPRKEAVAVVVVGLVAAPFLAANLLAFSLDPFWSTTYGRQNTTASSPPWMLAIDFGLLLPLAVVGAVISQERREGRILLGFWVLTLFAMMYLPVPFQRRFGFGLQPALAVLAGMGFSYLEKLWGQPGAGGKPVRDRAGGGPSMRPLLVRVGFRTIALTGLLSGTMLGYSLLLMAAGGGGPLGAAVFQPSVDVAAAEWLARNSNERDVVLASAETGNYLAGKIRGRVVLGHKAGTLDYPAKEALVKEFFGSSMTAMDRLELATSGRATMVFLGQRERALGGKPLQSEDGFRLVYDSGGVLIYRLEKGLS